MIVCAVHLSPSRGGANDNITEHKRMESERRHWPPRAGGRGAASPRRAAARYIRVRPLRRCRNRAHDGAEYGGGRELCNRRHEGIIAIDARNMGNCDLSDNRHVLRRTFHIC